MCVATSPKDGARTVRVQVFKRKKIIFLWRQKLRTPHCSACCPLKAQTSSCSDLPDRSNERLGRLWLPRLLVIAADRPSAESFLPL